VLEDALRGLLAPPLVDRFLERLVFRPLVDHALGTPALDSQDDPMKLAEQPH
jgi:hypothetical protein